MEFNPNIPDTAAQPAMEFSRRRRGKTFPPPNQVRGNRGTPLPAHQSAPSSMAADAEKVPFKFYQYSFSLHRHSKPSHKLCPKKRT